MILETLILAGIAKLVCIVTAVKVIKRGKHIRKLQKKAGKQEKQP
jgi:hypothetical protein